MGNTGKPSKDCQLCRKRRVKCDLAKPGCRRCAGYGEKCPGYRNVADLSFRNETPDSIQEGEKLAKARRHHKKQTSLLPAGSYAFVIQTQADVEQQTVTEPAIFLPRLHLNTEAIEAIPLILDRFTIPDSRAKPFGPLEFLPDLYAETKADSCLILVTQTFARAWRKFCHPTDREDKSVAKYYGIALRAVNKALCDPSDRKKDETATSIFLLGIYELMMSTPDKQPIPAPQAWHAHAQGLTALLQARGDEQFATRRGRQVFWATYGIVQMRCLAANLSCPADSTHWLDQLARTMEDGEMLRFMVSQYLFRACRVISKLFTSVMKQLPGEASRLAPTLLEEVADVGEGMQFDTILASPSGTSPDLCIVNLYRAARVKMHHWVVLFLNYVEAGTDPDVFAAAYAPQRRSSIKIVRQMVRNILDSTPALLAPRVNGQGGETRSWSDSMRLLMPLMFCRNFRSALPEQQREADKVLQFLGNELGIREALKSYPHPFQLPEAASWREENDVEGLT